MSNNQDRHDTCAFFFADGRRCKIPPSADDMGLCYFHAKKYRNQITAEVAGRQISEFLGNDILTACDLSSALATLFSATAQGFIKPKAAATLAYLGQLMLQTQRLAKQEFLESFDDRWPKVVQESICFNPPEPDPPAESPDPGLTPAKETPSDDPNPDTTDPQPIHKIM